MSVVMIIRNFRDTIMGLVSVYVDADAIISFRERESCFEFVFKSPVYIPREFFEEIERVSVTLSMEYRMGSFILLVWFD